MKASTRPEDLRPTLSRLAEYYSEVSRGKASVASEVHPQIVQLRHSLAYFGADRERPGDDAGGNPEGGLALVKEAVQAIDPLYDFGRQWRYVIIVHAGRDQAEVSPRSPSPLIWSRTFLNTPLLSSDIGLPLNRASVVSESSPLGTWAHEFAHLIGELPDMYESEPARRPLMGPWSLMDQGAFLDGGRTPSHLDAWSKAVMGWVLLNTTLASSGRTVLFLRPIETGSAGQALKIPIGARQFYVVEARGRTGFDAFLPDEGVLVYLVNEGNEISEAKVRVIDAHPRTETLNDAPFKPGESFQDRERGVFISVLSMELGRYRIAVSSSLTVQLSLQSPPQILALQRFAVSVNATPPISGLTLDFYVDGALYDTLKLSRDQYSFNLIFDLRRLGRHNITAVLQDQAGKIIARTSAEVYVGFPLIQSILVAAAILVVVGAYIAYRRRSSAKARATTQEGTPSTPANPLLEAELMSMNKGQARHRWP